MTLMVSGSFAALGGKRPFLPIQLQAIDGLPTRLDRLGVVLEGGIMALEWNSSFHWVHIVNR